ncbi:RNA polymerase sigma factor [Candidatus Roizmanbacteria bacterium]|nr:RNA polymerase sigma factor [Candidatus Roizmanbacteria bacterium]
MGNSDEEKQLVHKIISGDEAALIRFYRLEEKKLKAFITRTFSDPQIVDEVMQMAFFDFVEALPTFQFQSSLRTFLFSIAKHKIYDALRKKKIKQLVFSSLPAYFVEQLGAVFLEDELEQKELAESINTVLHKLPDEYALILRLKYIEDLSVKEIAAEFKMNFKAVESLLYRARIAFITSYEKQ